MRTLIMSMLAAALLVFSAASASAFNIRMNTTVQGSTTTLELSDTIIVHVFLDAPTPGLQSLSVSVLVDSPQLVYDSAASSALPIIYPPFFASTGNQAGYLLYAPPFGMVAFPGGLYPQQTPFQTWPTPPPGKQQVNINFANGAFTPTSATDTNLWRDVV